jgi:hypothetical protein
MDTHDAGASIVEPAVEPRPEVWANGLRSAASKGVMGTREDLLTWALSRETSLTEGLLSITDPHLLARPQLSTPPTTSFESTMESGHRRSAWPPVRRHCH